MASNAIPRQLPSAGDSEAIPPRFLMYIPSQSTGSGGQKILAKPVQSLLITIGSIEREDSVKRSYIFAIALVVFGYLPVLARIINIPDDYLTIQQGVDASIDGDTILVAPGTYTGNGNRDIDFHGKSILVMSESGPDSTIIDCQGSFPSPHRGFYFHRGEDSNSILDGFTITNGFEYGDGGGIYCQFSSPRIVNCNLLNNETDGSAGGFYCWGNGSSPILENCVFYQNSTGGYGGGLVCENSHLKLTGCSFNSNSAYHRGGAIYLIETSALIEDCQVTGNSAIEGGGIFLAVSDSTVLRNCIIQENYSEFGGSSLNCQHSLLNMIGCQISVNSSDLGDAMSFDSHSNPVLIDCAIFDNTGYGLAVGDSSSSIMYGCHIYDNEAGGIRFIASNSLMANCIVNDNASLEGAEITSYSSNLMIINSALLSTNPQGWQNEGDALSCFGNTEAVAINSILWANHVPDEYDYIFIDSVSSIAISYSNIQGGWGGEGNIDVDPLFRDPNNGDFHLMSIACGDTLDSPCIDAGHPDILDSLLDCSWGLGTIRSDMGAYGGGDSVTVGIDYEEIPMPDEFFVSQNYPNPFNAITVIRYNLPEPSNVAVEIFDILGRRVETLIQTEQPAGHHQVTWDAKGLTSGMYFCRIQAGDYAETKKMVLLK